MKITYFQSYTPQSRAGEVHPFKDLREGEYSTVSQYSPGWIYYIGHDNLEYSCYIRSEGPWRLDSEGRPHTRSTDNSKMRILSEEQVLKWGMSLCPYGS